MDLLGRLKNLKNIEPDEGYAERSRSLILNTERQIKLGVWDIVFRNLELGAALALVGVLMLLTIGGFSFWKGAAPLQISNLDPAGLKAEATAIDIQIQLMNLNYVGGASARSAESTVPSGPAVKKTITAVPTAVGTPSDGSASTTISIDEALLKLSE